MSGHATLTYRDLDKAYAFTRASQDDHGEVAADHPEFYRTVTANGTRRAPLPALSDREPCSFRDEEDAIIARLDGNVAEEDDGLIIDADMDAMLFGIEPIDDEAQYAMDDEHDDQEYYDAWNRRLDDMVAAIEGRRKVPSMPAVDVHFLREDAHFAHADVEASSDDVWTSPISGWRASLAGSDELRLDNGTGGYKGWKDTTKSPAQFMRHAGRVQPTFRRSGRTAA